MAPAQFKFMAKTYLTVPFKDKDAAKALGARWDAPQRQWFVPEGQELAPFEVWLLDKTTVLTAERSTASSIVTTNLTSLPVASSALLRLAKKGVTLSALLAGVSQAVALAYKTGVWTMVEVVELRTNGGHIFIGVSERASSGAVLAKTSAVIWQSTANIILAEFERATGAQMAPGIKLLVRARPVFKPLHGFTLEIDAIDSEYTLGDLEARKREIRERLHAEGVFDANKRLSVPWDFNNVLVVAPAGGAGLGDFQAEANRLEKFGVCCFTYAYSRFQGEGAATEICDALHAAISAWDILNSQPPDAVVIIRGGGAVNDLAWLNNYDLTRYLCDLPIPVWTGIGHERDSTLIDEVAHTKFDTPSKVIAGIEKLIAARVFEIQANFALITSVAATAIHAARAKVSALDVAVRADVLRHIANGRQETSELLSHVRVDAMQGIRFASEQSRDAFQLVKTEAAKQVAQAKRDVPTFWMQISVEAKHALKTAAEECESLKGQVLERAQLDAKQVRKATTVAFADVGTSARMWVREGANRSEALMREIAGQGPQKTLSRGFAIVRNKQGSTLTRAVQVTDVTEIEIQFSDGRITAVTGENI